MYGPLYFKAIDNKSQLTVTTGQFPFPWFDQRINSHYTTPVAAVTSNYKGVGP